MRSNIVSFVLLLSSLAGALGAQCPDGPEVRLDLGDPPGSNASLAPAFVLGPPDGLHAGWIDERTGTPEPFYAGSLDAGASWTPNPVRLNTGVAPNETQVRELTLAADGEGRVYAGWIDLRNSIPFSLVAEDLYVNSSTDGGQTWGAADVQVNTPPLPGNPNDPIPARIASAPDLLARPGGVVMALWAEQRGDERRSIRFSRSEDGGNTWLEDDVKVDTADPVGGGETIAPRLAFGNGVVYAVWIDSRPGGAGPGIYGNASTDGGLTWGPADRRLSTADGLGLNDFGRPAIVVDGNTVLVAWHDRRDGAADVFVVRSTNQGADWSAETRLDAGAPGGAFSFGPALMRNASDGVLSFWADDLDGAFDIHLVRSTDGGASWSSPPVRLDTGGAAGATPSFCMEGDMDGTRAAVFWRESRGGPVLLANRSEDAGASWLTPDLRIDAGSPSEPGCDGPETVIDPTGRAHVVWSDLRDGQADVYYRACGAVADPCGDGTCDGASNEDCQSCPADCACGAGETCDPSDPSADARGCVAPCGDGTCDLAAGEDCATCPVDCGCPADTVCDPGDPGADARGCTTCGNTLCDSAAGEDCETCVVDCGCAAGESCDPDNAGAGDDGCVSPCGDGACDSAAGEDCASCAADCACGAQQSCDPSDPDANDQGCIGDCGEPGSWRSPAEVEEPRIVVERLPGGFLVTWTDLAPEVGPSVVYDLATGGLGSLASTGTFDGSLCCEDNPDTDAGPADCGDLDGPRHWFLVRGENACGVGSFGSGTLPLGQDPREALDAASGPCSP